MELFPKDLINKKILVGITFVDSNEVVFDQYQTSGVVNDIRDGLIIMMRADGSKYQMPFDTQSMAKAKPGEYREKETGNIIVNPDYIMTWSIVAERQESIEDIKTFGFLPGA
jgi:hypothetical protein